MPLHLVLFLQRSTNTAEVEYRLTLDDSWSSVNELPPTVTPSGMSVERQQYLFDLSVHLLKQQISLVLGLPGKKNVLSQVH